MLWSTRSLAAVKFGAWGRDVGTGASSSPGPDLGTSYLGTDAPLGGRPDDIVDDAPIGARMDAHQRRAPCTSQ